MWLALVEPLLYKLFGSLLGDVQPWDIGSHPNAALGVVFFYLVFILAPRQIAYPGGSLRDWAERFALYMLGVIFNVGWLPLL